MSFKLDIPFYTFSLQFADGVRVRFPMKDSDAFQLGQSQVSIDKKFATLFQELVIDKGELIDVLDELCTGEFYKDKLTVHFDAAKDNISFPTLDLIFDYFYNPKESGFWGILPALGLEAFGADIKALELSLIEVVRLEFSKNRRLNVVQTVLESVWFAGVEMTNSTLSFNMPTLDEVYQNELKAKDSYLAKAAQKLHTKHQVLFGFEKEMQQLVKNVKNNYSRNVLLVGATGVGKTTMVWELVHQAKKHQIEGEIWETTASLLIKQLMSSEGWKSNLVNLAKELTGSEDFLFVRNLKELFEVGKHEGNDVSVAGYMQSFIAKGQIRLITECTADEFAQIDLENPGFVSLFNIVQLEQPEGKALENIILNKTKAIAESHSIEISKAAIQEIIRLTKRFSPYEGMPGRPIRFLERLILKKAGQLNVKQTVLPTEIIKQFCAESGLPIFLLDADIPMDLADISTYFNQNIFGQKKAIAAILDVLASVKMGLSKPDKPIASLLFVGPTGVGKTELAKTLTSFMLGDKNRMVRFDMSEYANAYAVERLAGRVGAEGLLSTTIRKNPFCVLLFDEIEKADNAFFDLLLQILSEGRLTDGTGKLVNFCSTLILMTSNIGAAAISRSSMQIGDKNEAEESANRYRTAVQKFFRPELYNRIDKVLTFSQLSKSDIRFIVAREMDAFKTREGIKYRKLTMNIQPEIYDYLGGKGYDKQYGARFLQRIIRNELIIPIAQALNTLEADEQLILNVFIENKQINTTIEADPKGFDMLMAELEMANFANYASSLRREVHNLKIGHLFVQFLSELDMMDTEFSKKTSSTENWKDPLQAKKYADYHKAKKQIEALTTTIEKYELDLSLSCLNFTTTDFTLQNQLEEWKNDFFFYKKHFISLLKPAVNTCYFNVYGQMPKMVIDFYLTIFEQLGFTIKAKSIWFRESFYTEDIIVKEETGEKHKKTRKEYIKSVFPIDKKTIEEKDVWLGVEFVLRGDCSFLQLKGEVGAQHWITEEGDNSIFIIQIDNKPIQTPTSIHRLEFYRQKSVYRKVEAKNVDKLRIIQGKSSAEMLYPTVLEYIEKNLTNELEKIIT